MNTGENIRKYRYQLEYTQKELAEDMGVAVSTICHWEKNDTEPSVTQAAKLMNILNIDFENLIE